ncbi:uncharacterized protein L969DRAFT_50486 [Mixia osmundae IAM 14324]|uniref:Ferritin-like diiron domain-containing protein n=1 Tax=Mixia osmundae (strain CBS 9802 / IAM 14324 / JCM 22182 / KY 12970) TaxID=764103 RepID=G7E708_MIXOS|nr:uncharacterized protein L969DRAFT_50486 [Mixia osmundae IAM 14324]KEI39000.1 hypothetical protein L969DRAFT_50486 [Mixia osmundae IAM 14324]GAA98618.1 hypothetical protein E5Q_05305 [Mixia osmundae IAM 14324]
MKAVAVISALAAASTVAAITDTQILQFALTLEHLESTFYKGVLARFDAHDFAKAGYGPSVRQRIVELGSDEQTHVNYLTAALKQDAVGPCKYSFPYNSVTGALGLARVLESVGVSAYLGAAPAISSPAYLEVAGSILSVEARHQGYVAETQKQSGFPSPFDIGIDPSQAYTLAAQFIVPGSCPAAVGALPVQDFPALTVETASPAAGKPISFKFASKSSAQKYAHFIFANAGGAMDIGLPLNSKDTVTFPKGALGPVYIIITDSADAVTDAHTIAGPAIVQLSDPDVSSKPWGKPAKSHKKKPCKKSHKA